MVLFKSGLQFLLSQPKKNTCTKIRTPEIKLIVSLTALKFRETEIFNIGKNADKARSNHSLVNIKKFRRLPIEGGRELKLSAHYGSPLPP